MKKISIYYIVILISLAILLLVGLQIYQARELYNQTLYELNSHIQNAVSKAVIRHEKADDLKRYTNFFTADFGKQYKKALKQEFQNIAPVEESVSIKPPIPQVPRPITGILKLLVSVL